MSKDHRLTRKEVDELLDLVCHKRNRYEILEKNKLDKQLKFYYNIEKKLERIKANG